jgi:hypothetical protein
MTDVGEMRVVVVERVRGGTVGERRCARWNILSNPATEAASLPPSSATKPRTILATGSLAPARVTVNQS